MDPANIDLEKKMQNYAKLCLKYVTYVSMKLICMQKFAFPSLLMGHLPHPFLGTSNDSDRVASRCHD